LPTFCRHFLPARAQGAYQSAGQKIGIDIERNPDVFYALREDLERINKERVEMGNRPIRGCSYNSYSKYWHWFKLLGLVEPTDRREPAIYDFLEEKHFYRSSDKGKTEVRA